MHTTPFFYALVLTAALVILAISAAKAAHRARRNARELRSRAEQRETERRSLRQMLADFEEECHLQAHDYRRAMGRGQVHP